MINHTTLLLDQGTWDLCLDAYGNIAVAGPPYAVAQDLASQLRTFLHECWYDSTQGMPYWQQVLGQLPPASLIVAALEAQAILVPDIASAVASIGGVGSTRNMLGQVIATDTDGNQYGFVL
jgi:hypothetical protein